MGYVETVYRTTDGKIFYCEEDANDWQDELNLRIPRYDVGIKVWFIDKNLKIKADTVKSSEWNSAQCSIVYKFAHYEHGKRQDSVFLTFDELANSLYNSAEDLTKTK